MTLENAVLALAESVTVPTTSIKALMKSGELARLLTPDWTPDPPGFLMTAALRPAELRIAGDYRVTIEHARHVTCATWAPRPGSSMRPCRARHSTKR